MTSFTKFSSIEPNPLVSIVINNYNYDRFLKEAIDSALNQTYQNIEVVVVDDGSTDNSREVIASYGDRIVPVLKENGGQCSCFNAGFAASCGEIICFLDADDIYLPEKIAEVVEIFKSSEEIGWCFHNLRWVNENAELLPQLSTQRPTVECDFRDLLKSGKLPPPLPATSALCFRRELLAQFLPKPISKAVKSTDFYVKYMAVALSKGSFLGKVLAFHRIHDSNAATLRKDKHNVYTIRAMEFILNGSWIKQEFPVLKRFANKLVSIGISLQWQNNRKDIVIQDFIRKYMKFSSFLEQIEINLRAFYHYIKSTLKPVN
ncbi:MULTISPECIES: glycosyltransferase family 2 protein [Calothrix]|uniref:Glycosyltransferase n=2 Tax=Calothrix TaxID=1186 RepID=A0ABR8AKZ2_9CYAN|nr:MULTISPECIES: glycosyltransferase [Calothrix]MBD2200205.1 glycosyltransferase [Calothrix parietina FACHB-288]MBD2229178.1 glycosyltransferase [Calothrix anomala FACHB-343]